MVHEDDIDSESGRQRAAQPSRRRFLKGATAGALATGLGLTGIGSAASSNGIPTPWLHRDGNLIKDPSGNEVILRGTNVADPKRIDVTAGARGKTAVQTVDYATSAEDGWYPRAIRVPVQPIDIGEHPPGTMAEPPKPPAFSQSELESYLTDHLDPVVEKCAQENVYCIVDFHRHWSGIDWADGNGTDLNPNEELTTEVTNFWNTVAPRYNDESHVIYEVYNEPVKPGIFADPADRNYQRQKWLEYVDIAQPWVDAIRSHADNLVLIGSPSWSQTPEGARVEEFAGEDLAYTYHIYAGHSISKSHDWANNNETGQGTSHVYEEVPLFVTEFGWQDGISAWPLIGTTDDFGKPFMEWLNSAPIHWTAWCFDPVWLPSMVKRSFEAGGATDSVGNPYAEEIPTYCEDLPCGWEPRGGQNMGTFIKKKLYELRDENVPESGGSTDSTPPTAPSNLTVTGSSGDAVTVAWESASDAGTGVDHYAVAVDGTGTATVPAGTTETTVANLSADTSYDVSVVAVDGAGNRSAAATVTATTDVGGTEVEPIDGTTPTDPDGDGEYEDLNGNGRVDSNDVVVYYEHRNDAAVTDHLDAYDYNDSGRIDYNDLVALFQERI